MVDAFDRMKMRFEMSARQHFTALATASHFAVVLGCFGDTRQASADLISSSPGSISCVQYDKNGERVIMGIPNELASGGVINHGGTAFYLNMGVDLRDFSTASSVPGPDPNPSRPDWSIEKFGFNPDLDVVSGPDEPPYRRLALEGKVPLIPTDMPGFLRFDTCSGCGTDLYLLAADPQLLAMSCYRPVGNSVTGCRVYQREGDMSLRFGIPYSQKQKLKLFTARIADLLSTFRDLGRDHCHEGDAKQR